MNQDYVAGQPKQPLYLQIFNRLVEQISTGVFPPGSKLPSEKELADEYGVSRITSKKAMDTLAANGYISRTPGRGTFVLNRSGDFSQPGSIAEGPKLIGVVMEKFSPSFGGDLILGIERECTRLGYTMALRFSYHNKTAEETAIAQLLELGVAGLIVMCVYDETYNPLILKLSLENFPVVLVDRELSGIPLPCVTTDNRMAAQRLTDTLFERGHRRLSFAVGKNSFQTSTVGERSQGFIQSCMNHGEMVDRSKWVTGLTSQDGDFTKEEEERLRRADVAVLKRFMMTHPEITGYLAASYSVAELCQQADEECGSPTGMPRCIACFDAPEMVSMAKPLIHIRQNQTEIGKIAVQHLIGRIQNKQLPRITYVDFELVT